MARAAKIRILFLDDDDSFLKMVSQRLSAEGYKITAHTDCAKAIDTIRRGKVDVAFVDFKMPRLNGIEVIGQIREFDSSIPLVLLTGHTDTAIMEKYKHLNIHGFFAKLDDFKKLGNLIQVILRGIDRASKKKV